MNKIRYYSVGQAAAMLGVSVSTLQRYDNEGILIPKRNEKGRRCYLIDDLEKFDSVKKNGGYSSNYSAKQFCKKIGVSEHYLRLLNQYGIIVPAKTESGYRYFTEIDVIKYFRQCKLNNANLEHITEISQTYSAAEIANRLNVSVSKLKSCGYEANVRPGEKHFLFYTNLDEDNLCRIFYS